jgi:hypothetical protein
VKSILERKSYLKPILFVDTFLKILNESIENKITTIGVDFGMALFIGNLWKFRNLKNETFKRVLRIVSRDLEIISKVYMKFGYNLVRRMPEEVDYQFEVLREIWDNLSETDSFLERRIIKSLNKSREKNFIE